MTRFIVMTAAAHMPSSCKGTYRRIAVVETDLPYGQKPKFIGDRAKGTVRVVKTWERLNCGTSPRCAYARAMREANELLTSLGGTPEPQAPRDPWTEYRMDIER
jgi:hypothetical protein